MKKQLLTSFILLLFCLSGSAQELNESSTSSEPNEQAQLSEEQKEYLDWATKLWESLDPQKGEIKLDSANATVMVPESYYFLNATDSQTVLVDVWGNPPGQAVLGMLFPEQYTPFDSEAWAVTIQYQEDGYITDEDAEEIDYNDLLKQMKADTREESKQRVAQGYGPIELVGWAATPFYNSDTNKLHWAQELRFDEEGPNTLNYNIRALGRKGVLVLNFIAGIDQKETIQNNLDSVLAMTNFDAGSQYSDFQPGVDKVAAYGIGALVAGKVLAKTGFIAALIIFLKKFGVFILIGIAAFARRLFTKKSA